MHYSDTSRESRACTEHIFTPFCVPESIAPYSTNILHFWPEFFMAGAP